MSLPFDPYREAWKYTLQSIEPAKDNRKIITLVKREPEVLKTTQFIGWGSEWKHYPSFAPLALGWKERLEALTEQAMYEGLITDLKVIQ